MRSLWFRTGRVLSIFQHLTCFLAFLPSLMTPPPSPVMRSLWFRTGRVLSIFQLSRFNCRSLSSTPSSLSIASNPPLLLLIPALAHTSASAAPHPDLLAQVIFVIQPDFLLKLLVVSKLLSLLATETL